MQISWASSLKYTILSDFIITQIYIGLFAYYLRIFLIYFISYIIDIYVHIRHTFATVPIKLSVRGVNESELPFFLNLLLME